MNLEVPSIGRPPGDTFGRLHDSTRRVGEPPPMFVPRPFRIATVPRPQTVDRIDRDARREERRPMPTEVQTVPVVRAMSEDNARWYDLSGQLLAVLLHGEETGGGLAAVEITETHGKPPPRHIHHRHDELVYVLEGEFTFEVAGRRQPAPTGTLVFIPRGTEHGFAVESASGRILVVITPAGLEEGFLEASHPAWSLDPATRPEPATYEHLLGLVEKYDGEVTGPPIDPRF